MKLTLNKAWELCMEQWEGWIIEQLKINDTLDIEDLKKNWCVENGYPKIRHYCFFCEYDRQRAGWLDTLCLECPGRKIDENFHCENRDDYNWQETPFAFYAELKRLNRRRKAKLNQSAQKPNPKQERKEAK